MTERTIKRSNWIVMFAVWSTRLFGVPIEVSPSFHFWGFCSFRWIILERTGIMTIRESRITKENRYGESELSIASNKATTTFLLISGKK